MQPDRLRSRTGRHPEQQRPGKGGVEGRAVGVAVHQEADGSSLHRGQGIRLGNSAPDRNVS